MGRAKASGGGKASSILHDEFQCSSAADSSLASSIQLMVKKR